MLPPPPTSRLFPYTTHFRSFRDGDVGDAAAVNIGPRRHDPFGREGLGRQHGLRSLVHGFLRSIARRSLAGRDRKSTRLNSSHTVISYAVFCLKKKKKTF